MRTVLAFAATAALAFGQDAAKKPTPPTLEETLAWLQKLPAIKGQPADRFSKLTVDDLKELTSIKLGGHREPDGKHQQIPGADFRYLTSLPKLEDCDLAEIDGLDDIALVHLGAIPTLKKLEMGDAQVTAAGLKALVPLKELTSLGLGWATKLDDGCVAHLAKMSKLEFLNLSGTKVTDAAVPYLAKLPLKELRLNATGVGDKGIAALAGVKSLETLEVKKSKVTARGVAALQKARPGLAVTTK
jgi:hypothetical protein